MSFCCLCERTDGVVFVSGWQLTLLAGKISLPSLAVDSATRQNLLSKSVVSPWRMSSCSPVLRSRQSHSTTISPTGWVFCSKAKSNLVDISSLCVSATMLIGVRCSKSVCFLVLKAICAVQFFFSINFLCFKSCELAETNTPLKPAEEEEKCEPAWTNRHKPSEPTETERSNKANSQKSTRKGQCSSAANLDTQHDRACLVHTLLEFFPILLTPDVLWWSG